MKRVSSGWQIICVAHPQKPFGPSSFAVFAVRKSMVGTVAENDHASSKNQRNNLAIFRFEGVARSDTISHDENPPTTLRPLVSEAYKIEMAEAGGSRRAAALGGCASYTNVIPKVAIIAITARAPRTMRHDGALTCRAIPAVALRWFPS